VWIQREGTAASEKLVVTETGKLDLSIYGLEPSTIRLNAADGLVNPRTGHTYFSAAETIESLKNDENTWGLSATTAIVLTGNPAPGDCCHTSFELRSRAVYNKLSATPILHILQMCSRLCICAPFETYIGLSATECIPTNCDCAMTVL
jgi:hypothetical protein